jgi:hypothetical protein
MSRNYTIINYFLYNKICMETIRNFPLDLSLFLYPCYHSLGYSVSSTLVLQMANTRNRNNNNNNGNDGGNNQDVNPPPPPPPTLEQVLIMQAQLLQIMQQTLVNMQAAPP